MSDLFNSFVDVAQSGLRLANQGRDRSRSIEYMSITTDVTRRLYDFESSLRQNGEYRLYGAQWEQETRQIREDMTADISDPVLLERLNAFWEQQTEQSYQRVDQMAWRREQDEGVATLERTLADSRDLPDFDAREQMINRQISIAQESGFIDETVAGRLAESELGQLLRDRAANELQTIYQQDGYDGAREWLAGDIGIYDDAREDLEIQLRRIKAYEDEERERMRGETRNSLHIGIYEGQTSMQQILGAPYLDASDREWLINIMRNHWSEGGAGAGMSEEALEDQFRQFEMRLDSGEDRFLVLAEADLVLPHRMHQNLREYEPQVELADRYSAATTRFERAGIVGTQALDALTQVREIVGEQLMIRLPDGRMVRNPDATQEQIHGAFETAVRRVIGEQVFETVTARQWQDTSLTPDETLSRSENFLMRIEEGAFAGHVDEYSDELNQALDAQREWLDNPMIRGRVQVVPDVAPRIDQTGRAIFRANTPIGGPLEVAFFMRDPNRSARVFSAPTLFAWDATPGVRRWVAIPEDGLARSGGEAATVRVVNPDGTTEERPLGEGRTAEEIMQEAAAQQQASEDEYLGNDSVFGASPREAPPSRGRIIDQQR